MGPKRDLEIFHLKQGHAARFEERKPATFLKGKPMSITLSELSQKLGVEHHGDGSVIILGFRSLDRQAPGMMVMAEESEQLEKVAPEVSCVLHSDQLEVDKPGIAHKNPRILLARILELFHPQAPPKPGIHDLATVDSRAEIHQSASVGPHCVVGPRVKLGAGVVLRAFVVIGEDSTVGEGSFLQPHVVIGAGCRIGRDCQLEPWAKVGESASLGDGVDLGAHANIGKEAEVQSGAKIDNLVLVGPRAKVGPGSLLVGQSAVDRDAVLHSGVVIAGQGSVGPEAVLHSGVQVGGRSLATGELKEAGPYLGTPAIPLKEEMRRRAREKKAQRG